MKGVYVIFIIFFSIGLSAQCGTDFNPQVKKYYNKYRNSKNGSVFQIPVKLHIIQASSGFGGLDSATVIAALNEVNIKFHDAGLEFFKCTPINYIKDNDYTYFIKNNSEDICDINDRGNAMNIYFAPELVKYTSSDTISLCGYAYMSGSKDRIIMDNDCADNGTTLSHEIGHYFSLYHTHEDNFGDEYANGTNCQTAGDLLCDTPADPKLSSSIVNTNCHYTGTDADPLGMQYAPDVNNLMAYGRKSCREYFSALQNDQMNFYAEVYRNYLSCFSAGIGNALDINSIKLNYNSHHNYIKISGLNTNEDYFVEVFDMMGRCIFIKKPDSEGMLFVEGAVKNKLYLVRLRIKDAPDLSKILLF
jgi:hypothetical protein